MSSGGNRVAQRQANTGHFEWGTPAYILDAARVAMGGVFDLDPASNASANKRVKASKIYTRADDGLIWPWVAERLWMNPPYSRKSLPLFIDKLLTEWHFGNVEQACVITNNSSETRWGQQLAKASSAICLLDGRVKFDLMDAETGEYVPNTEGNMTGQIVWYLDQDSSPAEFGVAFAQLGQCFWR